MRPSKWLVVGLILIMVGNASAYAGTVTLPDSRSGSYDNSEYCQNAGYGTMFQVNKDSTLDKVKIGDYHLGYTLKIKEYGGSELVSKNAESTTEVNIPLEPNKEYVAYMDSCRNSDTMSLDASNTVQDWTGSVQGRAYNCNSGSCGITYSGYSNTWNIEQFVFTTELNDAPKFNSKNVTPDPPEIGNSVSYSASASDPDGSVSDLELTVFQDGTQVYQNSVSSASNTWSDVYTPQSDGKLNARFTATDDAGATTTEWLNRTIDETPPSLKIYKPETPTKTRTGLPLNYTVSDKHLDTSTCKYSKDGGTNFSLQNCGNTTVDFGTVGNHELTVYASDTYNNTEKASKTLFVDEVNEIRAEDKSTNTEIEDFQVTLSNGTDAVGGQAVNGSFRFNTSNAPKGETTLTLKASGYTVRNETVQITDSYSLNKSFSLERAGLYIDAKDERTKSDIQFNLTLSNSTNVYSKEDITQLQEDYKDFNDKNISSGDVTASISSSDYQTREYFYSIDENSKISLTPYLLEKNQGIYVSLEIYDSAGSDIQDATLTVQRQFNGEWKTVSQKTTETTGGSSFFLDPETTYRFIASKTGYETFRGTFSPSNYQYDPLKIYLGKEETSKYSTVLESVEYNLRPREGIISGVQNFELNVTDKEEKLSSFGLKAYNETGGLESSSIVQTSPSGGSTSLEVNTTGMGNEVTVETFFQRENETYNYKNTFRVLKPLESGEFSLIQGKRYLEKHLSMFARSLLTILAVIGVTLPASKSKRLESNGAGAIGLAMLGTATAVNFFPQPIFILTLLPVIGIYLMRIR